MNNQIKIFIILFLFIYISIHGQNSNQQNFISSKHFVFPNIAISPIPAEELLELSEEIYTYVCNRMDTTIETNSITIFQSQSDGSTIRGRAEGINQSRSGIIIYIIPGIDRKQVLGVLAHELGHIFHGNIIKTGSVFHIYLNEGFATWLAGKYWLQWQNFNSFPEIVHEYTRQNQYIPLNIINNEYNTDDDIVLRDRAYNEWASFIDYLINNYGLKKFLKFLEMASGGNLENEIRSLDKDGYGLNRDDEFFNRMDPDSLRIITENLTKQMKNHISNLHQIAFYQFMANLQLS